MTQDEGDTGEVAWQGHVVLAATILNRWVTDARINPGRYRKAWKRREMKAHRDYALQCFEATKYAPDECAWLRIAAHVSGMQEVDILDRLLERAGVPYDFQIEPGEEGD